MKELRASAKEGTYSIKAKKNANPHGLMKAYLRSAPRMQDAMREIALEMARKKYTSKKPMKKQNRKAQLEVIYQLNKKKCEKIWDLSTTLSKGGCINVKGLNLDENLNRLIQENSDWAWEQAKREREEMEKKQKTQGGTDGKKDEV